MSGGVHEDIDITSYARRPVRLTIEIAIESDFADIFDVRADALVRRGVVNTRFVPVAPRAPDLVRERQLPARADHQRRQGRRAAAVRERQARVRRPHPAEGHLAHVPALAADHPVRLAPARDARLQRRRAVVRATSRGCRRSRSRRRTTRSAGRGSGPSATWRRSASRTRRSNAGSYIPAAGVPWYVTLFGRDTLVVSMQAISGYPEFASGALRRLGAMQATRDDPERDMEPGKIPHEVRHGELAQLGILPYQPYYGTHDATSLYLVVLLVPLPVARRRRVLRRYLAERRGRDALDRPLRRPRPGRVPGVPDAVVARLLQPGLEGRRRRDPPRRRHARAAAARDVRAPGLRLRREAPDGRRLRDPRPARRRPPPPARGEGAVRAVQRRVLVGGRGHVLPRRSTAPRSQ